MSITEISLLIILLSLLALSAFFSAAETAYSTINHAKFAADIRNKKKIAILIQKQYKSFSWILATIILSNSIVNVGLSTLSAFLFAQWLSDGPETAIITTAVVTPILVVVGEITPKLFAKKHAYAYLKKIARILQVLNWLFWPLTYPLSKITVNAAVTNTENDLASLIDIAKKEKVLEINEATLAQRALKLDSTLVASVMIKRKAIVTLDYNATILAAKKTFKASGHSRLIIKKDHKFVGLLLLKDILFKTDHQSFKDQIKPVVFVTAKQLISRALEKMRINRSHLALVLKNKHSTQTVGLITVEDILEELVGEIYDEHDTKQPVREIAHYKYVVDGSTSIKEVAQALKLKLPAMGELSVKKWLQKRIVRRIKKGLRYEYQDKIAFRVLENKRGKETLIEIVIKV